MVLKIHPGIGVARVGDSPDTFIGPETVDMPTMPAGGYRDDEGRIRRQAARFRVFDDTTPVAGTSVTWSVTFGTAARNGTATISGASQMATITAGSTVLAELRTDPDGNLLVLSCQVDSAGLGACGDGLVQATVAAGPVVSSWVVAVPPDFAPGIPPLLPMSFLFLDKLCALGLLSPPGPFHAISFRREVYPAIRGRTRLSPSELLALATPMARAAAAPFHSSAIGEPAGIEGAYLHAVVEHFHSGTFIDDWITPVPLDPAALDMGPLSFIDGSCPGGWELRFDPTSATLPFASAELRFSAATVTPGVLPPFIGWAGDVHMCFSEWATVNYAPLAAGDWRTRGFMVDTGSGLAYRDTHTVVTLVTTALDFGRVERGSAVARRIEFTFEDYFLSPLPYEFVSLPAPLEVLALSGTVADPPAALTVIFRAAMDAMPGPVTLPALEVHVQGQAFFVPATAEIVDPTKTQIALVLDCSTSMDDDRGDGRSKLVGLKQAVDVVIDVARENDGIAVAPFSTNALPGRVARALGDPTTSDPRRTAVHDFVDGLVTVDLTSIGDGIVSARSLLGSSPDPFDRDALVVITDGIETEPAWIHDVASSIREDTFAVGIGTSANVNEDHLREITSGHRGYLLLTGNTLSGPNHYRLEKYLLQILAGATNDQVILDPIGSVVPGVVSRVPFPVSDAEFRIEVAVVADAAAELGLGLLGPDGSVRSFAELAGEAGVQVVRRPRLGLARLPVPLTFKGGQSWGAGTWTLLLSDRTSPQGTSGEVLKAAMSARAELAARGKPKSFAAAVSARSSLTLSGQVHVPALESSRLVFEAQVGYAGIPLRSTPSVTAEVHTPQGSSVDVALAAVGGGRFVGELATTLRGDYSARLRARGFSPRGSRFARELTLTPTIGSVPSRDPRLSQRCCECHGPRAAPSKVRALLECLLAECRGRRA